MDAAQPLAHETPARVLGTLGDVLYAGRKAPVPEADWVALVRSVAAGDQVALHALYARANRPVFTLAVRVTGSRETAEEVTLDVFHDVWRRAPRYDPADGTVLGWIMNQARSRAIDRLRFDQARKRRVPEAPEGEHAQSFAVHDQVELAQTRTALVGALDLLTVDERRAVETAYFSEMTYAQAAAKLGEPVGTIKTRIRSALHKLRRALEEASP